MVFLNPFEMTGRLGFGGRREYNPRRRTESGFRVLAEAWSEDPFTTHIKLDGSSSVPSPFRTPGTFTVTRLESTAGLPDRITKLSSVPALLVSISLKSLPLHSYQVWVADKIVPTHRSFLAFRSNVIDFDSEPSCWAGEAFDYVHYTLLRAELDDIAADFGFRPRKQLQVIGC